MADVLQSIFTHDQYFEAILHVIDDNDPLIIVTAPNGNNQGFSWFSPGQCLENEPARKKYCRCFLTLD